MKAELIIFSGFVVAWMMMMTQNHDIDIEKIHSVPWLVAACFPIIMTAWGIFGEKD